MATIKLTQDFKEFLSLLNSKNVKYLLIGGYAVGLYGYVRPTKDMDVWISTSPDNLALVIEVLSLFGFDRGSVTPDQFTGPQTIMRMGLPPNRLELMTKIDGVDFDDCYPRRTRIELDGIPVDVISLHDLRTNKLSSARLKDLADAEQLGLGPSND